MYFDLTKTPQKQTRFEEKTTKQQQQTRMNNKHCCSICGSGYKTQTKLERHLLLCEFLYKAKQNNYKGVGIGLGGGGGGPDDEQLAIPSQKVMYQLLLDLGQKCNRLEEKLETVNSWVNNQKRKKTNQIDIVDWLNKNNKPSLCTFERLADHVRIEISDVEHLMQHPFYDTMAFILSRCLYSDAASSSSLPLFASVCKSNKLYAYFDTLDWSELSRDKLVRFLNIVHKKISRAMLDWKREHRDEIGGSDHIATVFDKGLLKLMSINFNNDVTFNKMNLMLYSSTFKKGGAKAETF